MDEFPDPKVNFTYEGLMYLEPCIVPVVYINNLLISVRT